MQHLEAIVLAMFGTTVEPALQSLLAIRSAMEAAFPLVPVKIAFTSNQIRHIWHKRAADSHYRETHPEVPADIFAIQGILATIANLQDQGYTTQVIQSIHIAPAEEFHDLVSYVRALASIRTMKPRWQPFQKIALGRPLLGSYSLKHPYTDDLQQVTLALAEDAQLARSHEAALVYMGHGNHYFPAGGLFLEFAAQMRARYPEVHTLIGTVEGFPDFSSVLETLHKNSIKRVVLKPFLIVAGEHATKDLVGPDEDSWKSQLLAQGFEVIEQLTGLGEQPAIADLFVTHAAEAAAAQGIVLRQ